MLVLCSTAVYAVTQSIFLGLPCCAPQLKVAQCIPSPARSEFIVHCLTQTQNVDKKMYESKYAVKIQLETFNTVKCFSHAVVLFCGVNLKQIVGTSRGSRIHPVRPLFSSSPWHHISLSSCDTPWNSSLPNSASNWLKNKDCLKVTGLHFCQLFKVCIYLKGPLAN